ncbi:terminase large subunit domain-containing protein [Marinibaculum pumilum]|uniref:Terminase large subunit domain-containing protein n=1 Tax=Marinibaculum pumilum TaxID=1766165 RepID=A0ABV7LA32_9PROT
MRRLRPREVEALLADLAAVESRRRLEDYRPYPKQAAFHRAGASHRERLLRAGNQLGKTWCGGAEAAYHLTGLYPDWWRGRRWARPVMAWAAGHTGEATRDTVQRVLLGRPGSPGTGLIPAAALGSAMAARGQGGLVDRVTVAHAAGGQSVLKFKTYDQGRERWQGETLDFVWFDEEPPADVYSEGLTRTNATGGLVWLTFTPLLGMSEVVRRFLMEHSPDRADICMTIEDAAHIPPDARARILAAYPPHEREARARGVPALGSGRIFPVAESLLAVAAFPLPPHWVLLGAIDFGWDHPTAAVRLAWDRDADIVYLTACYRVVEAVPAIHAAALKPWGPAMPWAWPHDGVNRSPGGGKPLAQQYREAGLNMLADRAAFADGSTSVEAGLMELLQRMQTGRLKVFAHLADWFEEFRLYHRKDGRVVKQADDLMDATRYGIMCLRHARADERLLPPPPASEGGASDSWMG